MNWRGREKSVFQRLHSKKAVAYVVLQNIVSPKIDLMKRSVAFYPEQVLQ